MKNLNEFKLTKVASKSILGGTDPEQEPGTWQKTHSGGAEFKDYID